MRRELLIGSALMLLAVAVAGCGWQPYPHASSPPTPSVGTPHVKAHCRGKAGQIQCLLGQIRPTTNKAELHRIFRDLRRLGVRCTGTPATEISCTGSGAGEGWELGFATTAPDNGVIGGGTGTTADSPS